MSALTAERETRTRTVTPIEHNLTNQNVSTSYSYQAYQILHWGFVAAPILAGADKFFHVMVDWNQYLSPLVTRTLPISPDAFMKGVGVIEIVAGILVAVKPKIGAYVVSAWLFGIIINLLTIPGYFDIALRDFGLALGALALGRLSHAFDR